MICYLVHTCSAHPVQYNDVTIIFVLRRHVFAGNLTYDVQTVLLILNIVFDRMVFYGPFADGNVRKYAKKHFEIEDEIRLPYIGPSSGLLKR